MPEDKNTILSPLAEPISNATNNILDKPTQSMGTTLNDIWFLVFGGISQTAEMRRLKYSFALQEFKNELQDKISKIPEDKQIEPDMQIVAPALDSAKYCMKKQELRTLFSNLISSSMNADHSKNVHPTFTNIIRQLSTTDAKLIKKFFKCINTHKPGYVTIKLNLNYSEMILSLTTLESLGLIYTDIKDNTFKYATKDDLTYANALDLRKFHIKVTAQDNKKMFRIHFTNLGIRFCQICITI